MDFSTGNHVIKFWAVWCGPCKQYKPTFDEAASSFKEAQVHDVNIEDHSDVAQKFGVKGIPFTVFVKDGNVVDQRAGILDKGTLEQIYKKSFNIIEEEDF